MHADINRKIEALSEYLPKQMTAEEVKEIEAFLK